MNDYGVSDNDMGREELDRRLSRLSDFSDPATHCSRGAGELGAYSQGDTPAGFWARITGQEAYTGSGLQQRWLYSWQKLQRTSSGGFIDSEPPLLGSYDGGDAGWASEVNRNTSVPVGEPADEEGDSSGGVVVWMTQSAFGEGWDFFYPGSQAPVTVPQWTGVQSNYVVPDAGDTFYVSTSASYAVNGMVLTPGRTVTFVNTGTNPILWPSGSGSAGNVLDVPGDGTLTLGAGDSVTWVGTASGPTLVSTTAAIERPAQSVSLTGNTNDLAVTPNVTVVNVASSTGDYDLTGFTGGTPGRQLTIVNSTTSLITVPNNSGSSSSNQVTTGTGNSFGLYPGTSMVITYDGGTSKWVIDRPTPPPPYTPSLSTNQNNYALTSTVFVPVLGADVTFTGFDASLMPLGVPYTLVNPYGSGFDVTVSNLSGSSSAGNQVVTGTGSDLVVGPGEAVQLVNAGGNVLVSGGSLALPPGGGPSGAGTLLGTFTAANAATLDCTGLGGYKLIKLFGYGFQTKNALLTNLLLRTSANNGSSYDAGSSDYNSGAGTAAQITISVALPPDSAAANALSFEVTVYEADVSGASRYKIVQWNSSAYGGGLTNSTGSGARLSDGVINAVRLLGTTANLNGTVKAYGYN